MYSTKFQFRQHLFHLVCVSHVEHVIYDHFLLQQLLFNDWNMCCSDKQHRILIWRHVRCHFFWSLVKQISVLLCWGVSAPSIDTPAPSSRNWDSVGGNARTPSDRGLSTSWRKWPRKWASSDNNERHRSSMTQPESAFVLVTNYQSSSESMFAPTLWTNGRGSPCVSGTIQHVIRSTIIWSSSFICSNPLRTSFSVYSRVNGFLMHVYVIRDTFLWNQKTSEVLCKASLT